MNRAIRLIASSDFKAVVSKGRKISSPLFNLYWLAGSRLRVGIMVSKKVSKRAVDRNLIKRRVREIVANETDRALPLTIVISAKSPVLEAEFKTLRDELIHKIKLIKVASTVAPDQKTFSRK